MAHTFWTISSIQRKQRRSKQILQEEPIMNQNGKRLHSENNADLTETTLCDEACCAICFEVLFDPVFCLCGHSFDRACLQRFLGQVVSAKRCPSCRHPVPEMSNLGHSMRHLVQTCFPLAVERRSEEEKQLTKIAKSNAALRQSIEGASIEELAEIVCTETNSTTDPQRLRALLALALGASGSASSAAQQRDLLREDDVVALRARVTTDTWDERNRAGARDPHCCSRRGGSQLCRAWVGTTAPRVAERQNRDC